MSKLSLLNYKVFQSHFLKCKFNFQQVSHCRISWQDAWLTSDEIPPKKLKEFKELRNRPSNRPLRQPNTPMSSPAINVITEDIQSVQISEPNPPSQHTNAQMSSADELDNNSMVEDEASEKSSTLAPASEFFE